MKTIVAALLLAAGISAANAAEQAPQCVNAAQHACVALRQQVLDAKRLFVCHENKPWGEEYVSEQGLCKWPNTQINSGWVKAKDGWCLIGYWCSVPNGGA